MMKIKLVTLSVALLIACTACEQKPETVAKAVEAGKQMAQKVQEAVPQAVNNAVQTSKEAVDAGKDAVDAGKNTAVKSAVAVKETTEQALADTSDKAREITKTQVSASRQHAQSAEDEMNAELAKHK